MKLSHQDAQSTDGSNPSVVSYYEFDGKLDALIVRHRAIKEKYPDTEDSS